MYISWPLFGWWECGYKEADTKEYIAWSILKSNEFLHSNFINRIDHEGNSPSWSAGLVFVITKKYGKGLLIVPDSVDGLAYLYFRNGDQFETKKEAHKLGFGYHQFIKERKPKDMIEMEVSDDVWVKNK